MSNPQYVPEDVSRMECLVISHTLHAMKEAILNGTPSGLVVDQALEEAMELATRPARARAA